MRNIELFIQLVRLGIGHPVGRISCDIEWKEVQTLAEQQGLSAIVLDGLNSLPITAYSLPLEMKLEWIGEVLQNYEGRYSEYKKAIGSLAGFYNQHGFKMMVLKGYACSMNWPTPEHRPCGAIDIWQFGEQKEADKVLSTTDFTDYTNRESLREKSQEDLNQNQSRIREFENKTSTNTNRTDNTNKFEIDNSHHHHSVFEWGEFTVENHYDFINVHHHRSSAELESIFKELGMNDTCTVDVCGEKVYLPSPNLHALFLLKHSMSDFAAFFITLRQVLDWGFHVQKYHDEIDWDWLKEVMEMYHMTEFFNTINAICVEDLGFESSIFPYLQFNPMLKEKVLLDIMEPKFPREEPHGLVKRMIFKFRRWKGNSWKHEMCYNESLWSAFWSGVWNHVTKPASI